MSVDINTPHGRRASEDVVKRALAWAARWEPATELREGMLAEAVARGFAQRRCDLGRRLALMTAGISIPVVVATAWMVGTRLFTHGMAGNSAHTGRIRIATVSSLVRRPQSADAMESNVSEQRIGLRPAAAAIQRRSSPLSTATARFESRNRRQQRRLPRNPYQRPADSPRWTTVRVPRYVAGIATAGWLKPSEDDDGTSAVPIMVSIPLEVGYGDSTDSDVSELDVIPVRHVMEVNNE